MSTGESPSALHIGTPVAGRTQPNTTGVCLQGVYIVRSTSGSQPVRDAAEDDPEKTEGASE
jgi:hypothetical protein